MADRPLAGVVETGLGVLGRGGFAESPLVDAFLLPVEINRAVRMTTGFVIDLMGLGPTSELDVDLPAGGMSVLRTRGDVAPIVGAARVEGEQGIVARLEMTRPELGALTVVPSSIMEAFVAPVIRDLARGTTTEVSVHNPGPATEIRWVLRNANGVPAPGGSAVSSIPANGRIGALIQELFPGADTDDFRGTLTGEVSSGAVAAVVLQLRDDPAGTFVLPVTPTY